MINPKDFAPTSWGFKGKIDKSGPNKSLSAHGRPTAVKATGMDMQGPTPKSGGGYKALGHGGSEGIGNPYAMSSDRSEMPVAAKAGKVEKSKTLVPREVKKWHKKGYDLSVPATEGEGSRIAAKMKAH